MIVYIFAYIYMHSTHAYQRTYIYPAHTHACAYLNINCYLDVFIQCPKAAVGGGMTPSCKHTYIPIYVCIYIYIYTHTCAYLYLLLSRCVHIVSKRSRRGWNDSRLRARIHTNIHIICVCVCAYLYLLLSRCVRIVSKRSRRGWNDSKFPRGIWTMTTWFRGGVATSTAPLSSVRLSSHCMYVCVYVCMYMSI
jgi:hypothetical protein